MTCEEVRTNFVFYLQKKLSKEALLAMTHHLGSCASCASELEGFAQIERDLDRLPDINPSPYFDVCLNARLDELQSQPKQTWIGWWRIKLLDWHVLSLVFLMIATVSVWLGIRHEQYRELNSLQKVIEVQDRYLGSSNQTGATETGPSVQIAKQDGQKDSHQKEALATSVDKDEEIPEQDRALLENLDLLQNYEILSSLEAADRYEGAKKRVTD